MKIKRMLNTQTQELYGYRFNCPGCGSPHVVGTGWQFNGDMERPTFSPSVLVTSVQHKLVGEGEVAAHDGVCHSFITDGRIQFLGDCTHELAGRTVELPEVIS